jgi:hypothetical protein
VLSGARRLGDLVYAFFFGVLVVLGVSIAGEALIEAAQADSATFRWEPIAFGLGVVAGAAAYRAVRRRQRRQRERSDFAEAARRG